MNQLANEHKKKFQQEQEAKAEILKKRREDEEYEKKEERENKAAALGLMKDFVTSFKDVLSPDRFHSPGINLAHPSHSEELSEVKGEMLSLKREFKDFKDNIQQNQTQTNLLLTDILKSLREAKES